MQKAITSFVGLDVHQDSIAVAVAVAGAEEPRFVGTVVPQWAPLSKALSRLGRREGLQIVYEAGPCGYTLARQLRAHGYACEVIAPSKIARRPGDRIKTDRRDALLLARAARAGELVSVTDPRRARRGAAGSVAYARGCRARSSQGAPAAQGTAAAPRASLQRSLVLDASA